MAVNCLAGCNFMYSYYLLEWNTLFLVGKSVGLFHMFEGRKFPKQAFKKKIGSVNCGYTDNSLKKVLWFD